MRGLLPLFISAGFLTFTRVDSLRLGSYWRSVGEQRSASAPGAELEDNGPKLLSKA